MDSGYTSIGSSEGGRPNREYPYASPRHWLHQSNETLSVVSDVLPSVNLDEGKRDHEPYEQTPPRSCISFIDLWWLAEVLSCFISIACIVAIVIILQLHDGQPFSSWKFYFSINTVVSTLGTAARASVLFAISAGISQYKWIWSKRGGKLVTFEAIDNASRGPYGSLQLIFTIRSTHVIIIGAITSVFALMTEPMLQAVLTEKGQLDSVNKSVRAGLALSNRCSGGSIVDYSGYKVESNDGNIYGITSTFPELTIVSAIYNGFQAALNGTPNSASNYCTTGNCTWPVFTSLGVCSSCNDVSKNLMKQSLDGEEFMGTADITHGPFGDYGTLSTPGTQFNLPSTGLHINNVDLGKFELIELMVGNMTADPKSTYSFTHSQTLLAAFSFIRASRAFLSNEVSWKDSSPIATECGLELCLKVFDSIVVEGTLIEHILAEQSRKVANSWLPSSWLGIGNQTTVATVQWNPLWQRYHVARDDFQLSPEGLDEAWYPANATFNASQAFLASTVDFIWTLIPSSYAQTPPLSVVSHNNDPLMYSSPIMKPLYQASNLSYVFDLIAESMTNAIRNAGSDIHQGNTQQWAPHYHIRWAFFTLPIAVVASGTLFTALLIYLSNREGLEPWKSSTLAIMTYGIDEETRKQMRTACLTERLREAGKMRVQLHQKADGIELAAPLSEASHGGDDIHQQGGEALENPRPNQPSTLVVGNHHMLPQLDFDPQETGDSLLGVLPAREEENSVFTGLLEAIEEEEGRADATMTASQGPIARSH